MRTAARKLNNTVQSGLNFLLPQHCALCHQPVPPGETAGNNRPRRICHWCIAALPGLGLARCSWCGIPLNNPLNSPVCTGQPVRPPRCPACHTHNPQRCLTLVLGHYRSPLSDLVRQLKYHRQTDLGVALVQVHADFLLKYASPGALPLAACPDVVMPVPLADSRLRNRGFNQAGILARAYGRLLNRPLDQRTLVRRDNHRASQVGRSRRQRLQTVTGSFVACQPVPARHVLLVDDVMTTGATLNAATDALLKAGATAVTRVVIARTE